jgi:DNA/RNA-binding domain of Phe-tRNA-synthetase-like protein
MFPSLQLGIVVVQVKNSQYHPQLWEEIKTVEEKLINQYDITQVNNIPEIAATRNTYKKLGKDPSRYRGSAEALLRRILQGKGLYQVNTIVDINNLLSLQTLCPVGSYHLKHIEPPFAFRIGLKDEFYKGIGKETLNLYCLPILSDVSGPFGSPTSDSERSMIQLETDQIMIVIFSFSGETNLHSAVNRAKDLLSFVQATNINSIIIK